MFEKKFRINFGFGPGSHCCSLYTKFDDQFWKFGGGGDLFRRVELINGNNHKTGKRSVLSTYFNSYEISTWAQQLNLLFNKRMVGRKKTNFWSLRQALSHILLLLFLSKDRYKSVDGVFVLADDSRKNRHGAEEWNCKKKDNFEHQQLSLEIIFNKKCARGVDDLCVSEWVNSI